MPAARSTAVAVGCAVATALGGAAFVQPSSLRARAGYQPAAAGLQRWEPAIEQEAPQTEGSPVKGLVLGLTLGLAVALVGVQEAQAADATAKKDDGKIPSLVDGASMKEVEAYAKKVAKPFQSPHFSKIGEGGAFPKRYTATSTGTGRFLEYNLGTYSDFPNYQGTVKNNGQYAFRPQQVANFKARKQQIKDIAANAKPFLKDGGKYGNVFPSAGMYKPRTYTSEYEPIRLK